MQAFITQAMELIDENCKLKNIRKNYESLIATTPEEMKELSDIDIENFSNAIYNGEDPTNLFGINQKFDYTNTDNQILSPSLHLRNKQYDNLIDEHCHDTDLENPNLPGNKNLEDVLMQNQIALKEAIALSIKDLK